MQLLRENKLLGAKGELEFLYFIGEGNWNTFDADANSKFRLFRENLKLCIKEHLKASYQNVPTPEILEQQYLELDKRFNITLCLTCLSMLASQKVFNESIVGRFMSIKPSTQITLDTELRQFFPELLFGCFRSGAMMNEQLLTHFLMQNGGVEDDRTHNIVI